MANNRISGGGNRLTLYKININSSSTVTFASTSTVFDQTVSTTIGRSETGYTISLDQIKCDSTVLTTFLEEALVLGQTAGEAITFEDATEVSASANSTQYLAVVSGGVDGANRLCFTAIVTLDPSSGGLGMSANTYNRPSLSFTSVAAATDVTIGTSNFPTSHFTAAAAVTLSYSTQRYGAYKFIPKNS